MEFAEGRFSIYRHPCPSEPSSRDDDDGNYTAALHLYKPFITLNPKTLKHQIPNPEPDVILMRSRLALAAQEHIRSVRTILFPESYFPKPY